MFTLDDFKVKLVNGEDVKSFIKKHGEFAAVCYNTPKEKAEAVGLHCLKSGHFSGSRHLHFVFELKNVPRSAVDQLVRHRMDEAGKAVGNTVTLFMVLAAALMAVLLCLARPIVILIGTPEEAVAETVQYLVI